MEWIAVSIALGVVAVLSFTYGIVKMGLAHEDRKLALEAGQGDATRLEQILASNHAEMANLRERVQVLEKLATDDDRRLAGEIDRLRTAEVRG